MILKFIGGNSLAVQWLGLHAFTAKGWGSIPGWGTEIPTSCVAWPKKFIGALFKKKKSLKGFGAGVDEKKL